MPSIFHPGGQLAAVKLPHLVRVALSSGADGNINNPDFRSQQADMDISDSSAPYGSHVDTGSA
jgi:hypothetical protein